MGPGHQRQGADGASNEVFTYAGEQATCRPRCLRAKTAGCVEISCLCADIVRLRLNRKRHRENIPDIGKSCYRAPPAYRNRRDEPLPQACGFRARLGSRPPASADLLYNAGGRRSSDFRHLHRSPSEVALRLPAFPGKPDSPRLWIRWIADLDQESGQRLSRPPSLAPDRGHPASLTEYFFSLSPGTNDQSTALDSCPDRSPYDHAISLAGLRSGKLRDPGLRLRYGSAPEHDGRVAFKLHRERQQDGGKRGSAQQPRPARDPGNHASVQ